jgi:GTP diphosphokinase / guanosine-3',5'-bis(diphosphate) 3'-diphosphatase
MTEVIKQTAHTKYFDHFNLLTEDLKDHKHSESHELIYKAFDLLIERRENDKTFYGKDLIISIIDAARIAVREIGLGHTSVVSLFVYHAFSKGPVDINFVKSEFNESIAHITDGLSKVSLLNDKTSSSQAENFRRLLLNLAKDVRVILIRLAEQTKIMRELRHIKPEDQVRIASEASFLYAPLAHRLGLYLLKSEMEDLSLKYIDRTNYSMIAKKLSATMKARKTFIDEFIFPLRTELGRLGFKFEIKGRPKSIFSIWNKMKRKGVEFEDVYDLFAIRIILKSELKNEKAECWQAYSAVTDIYLPNPLRLRDWISVPKSNGYESLHTTVIGPGGTWVEVQIRTERMNEIAEKGVAAHWKYKGLEGSHGIDEWLSKIRETLESPEQDAGNFIDDFKLSLYSKEIFVFTPKGDLRKFPEGATVLDFAYDIHTDVGSTCTGARLNGKSVPIRHKLQNGDRIEIFNSKNQKPNLDWLNFVVTSKAQKKIRQQLNEEKVKEAENGKEIIKRRFKNWKINYDDEVVRKLIRKYKLPNAQELYYLISLEKIDLSEVKDFILAEQSTPEPEASLMTEDFETTNRRIITKEFDKDFLVIDEDVEDIDFKLAKCCSPIRGDNIFGFVTVNEGVKIHRTNCPNAVQLIGKYGYRVVKAKWTFKGTDQVFPVDIKISGEDQTGILNSISEIIAKEMRVSVKSISLDAAGGIFSGIISLLVKDINHLDSLMKKLSTLKGIYSVHRSEPKQF